jgi:hypothetical protein
MMANTVGSTYSDLFAQEQTLQTESLDEAQRAMREIFRYQRTETSLEQMFLDEDLHLRCNGECYQMTQKAFQELVAQVGLTWQVAQKFPTDLAATVVKRLAGMEQKSVVPVTRDDVCVAVVDPNKWTRPKSAESAGGQRQRQYDPLPILTVLDVIKEIRKSDGQTLRLTISDSGLAAELVHADLAVEPRVNDITQVGVRITASETGGDAPLASGYTLRLVCLNGAVLSEDFGVVRFDTDPRVKVERRVQKWAEAVAAYVPDVRVLESAYACMAESHLTDKQFYDLHRRVTYIYRMTQERDARTDAALGVGADEREATVAQVRQREKRRRKGEEVEGPAETDFATWAIFNALTAQARQETYQRRLDLEGLAGNVLKTYVPGLN